MYRVVLYGLLILAAISIALGFAGQLEYHGVSLLISLCILISVGVVTNYFFSQIFKVTTGIESSLITSLILFFIVFPVNSFSSGTTVALIGFVAIASKYILVYRKKHIFNPAALAVFVFFYLDSGAVWWVATPVLIVPTTMLCVLVVRKIRRFTLFFSFATTAILVYLIVSLSTKLVLSEAFFTQIFTSWPLIFFGAIMLTEPATTPPTRKLQIVYGVLVGFLFSFQLKLLFFYPTPEFALIVSNIFSFIVSSKYRLYLRLKSKTELASNITEVSFNKPSFFTFKPGQYLEWTLPILKADSRGNRRYFTIASSPTENEIKLGIRFNEPPSSFKKRLHALGKNDTATAGQLLGDFTLPSDTSKKLVFIAGGIGVTPFRSMIKYLLDVGEERDIVFFYANKVKNEIAYKELFDEAVKKLGISIVYILSEDEEISTDWKGEKGRIDKKMLKKHVSDISERTFYLSGPNSMVTNYKKLLRSLGVRSSAIVTDYFPGF
ncbi:MAG: oxidoreductase [Candidatus Levybacteria bacterium]|nr:oxidoreductase [Candidatus Levybacteria bacterium]